MSCNKRLGQRDEEHSLCIWNVKTKVSCCSKVVSRISAFLASSPDTYTELNVVSISTRFHDRETSANQAPFATMLGVPISADQTISNSNGTRQTPFHLQGGRRPVCPGKGVGRQEALQSVPERLKALSRALPGRTLSVPDAVLGAEGRSVSSHPRRRNTCTMFKLTTPAAFIQGFIRNRLEENPAVTTTELCKAISETTNVSGKETVCDVKKFKKRTVCSSERSLTR